MKCDEGGTNERNGNSRNEGWGVVVDDVDATGAAGRCGAGELVPLRLPVPVPVPVPVPTPVGGVAVIGLDFLDISGSDSGRRDEESEEVELAIVDRRSKRVTD